MKAQKKSIGRGSLLDEQKETRKKIGERIKQLRRATGLSQEKFANLQGLDRTLVSRMERGETNFEWITLVTFFRALDVTMEAFFAGIE
jgi:transcriptional regulator with XRE-family HTH domain